MSFDQDFDPVAYINTPRWQQSRYGLERIVELMQKLGNPQDRMHIVHVAGTNGKGSTCAMTANILHEAGYTVGLFTSPYIIEFSDRIRINGRNITPDALKEATLAVREIASAMEDHPTEFELMTAVALVAFERAQCEMVVLEVGMGGRLDSTNVIAAPEVCAITPISFDHMAFLGTTLDAIAREKAGIIKSGALVVSAPQELEAQEVITAVAHECGTQVAWVDCAKLHGTPQSFSYQDWDNLSIPLLGSYQTSNAALALEIVGALRARGFDISDAAVRAGLSGVSWHGRFEVVSKQPIFVLDGGHNTQGAQALVLSLELNFPNRRVVFVMGVLADKEYDSMISCVLPYAAHVICITPPNPRALNAHDLAAEVKRVIHEQAELSVETDLAVEETSSIKEGVARAFQVVGEQEIICAFGSLYSIADIMTTLKER